MIKADYKKKTVEIEGTASNILTELTMIIHNIVEEIDVKEDTIRCAIELGFAGEKPEDLLECMLNQLKKSLKNKLKED